MATIPGASIATITTARTSHDGFPAEHRVASVGECAREGVGNPVDQVGHEVRRQPTRELGQPAQQQQHREQHRTQHDARRDAAQHAAR
jgi:hypothetical protein